MAWALARPLLPEASGLLREMTSESRRNHLLRRTGSETHAIINGRGSDQLYLQIIEACNFNFVLQLNLIYLHVDSYGVSGEGGMRITQVYDAF